jgi:hypothetical protein
MPDLSELEPNPMGRPKKGSKPPAKPKATEERVAILLLRDTAEYAAWLDQIHERTYIPKATIVRVALREWAERHGHPAPPAKPKGGPR